MNVFDFFVIQYIINNKEIKIHICYDRYTFFGKEPEEIITSRGDALVIRRNNGTEEIRQGKSRPLKNITSGEHFHTVSADSAQTLDLIEEELRKKDYLVRTVK